MPYDGTSSQVEGPVNHLYHVQPVRKKIAILVPDFGGSVLDFGGDKFWDVDDLEAMEALSLDDFSHKNAANLGVDIPSLSSKNELLKFSEEHALRQKFDQGWGQVSLHMYGGLLAEFEKRKGCKAYALGYDFRKSIEAMRVEIAEKIKQILAYEKDAEVILIGHGTGAELARSLLADGTLKEEDYDGFVQINPLPQGSPQALRTALHWQPKDQEGLFAPFANNQEEVLKFLEAVPGAALLMPTTNLAGEWELPSSGLTDESLTLYPLSLDGHIKSKASKEKVLDRMRAANEFRQKIGLKLGHENTFVICSTGVATEETPHWQQAPEPVEASSTLGQMHLGIREAELPNGHYVEIGPERPAAWSLRTNKFLKGDGRSEVHASSSLLPNQQFSSRDVQLFLRRKKDGKPVPQQVIVEGVEHYNPSHPTVRRSVARIRDELLDHLVVQNQRGGVKIDQEEVWNKPIKEAIKRKDLEPPLGRNLPVNYHDPYNLHHILASSPGGEIADSIHDQYVGLAGTMLMGEGPELEEQEDEAMPSIPNIIDLDIKSSYEQLISDPDQWLKDQCVAHGITLSDFRSDPDRKDVYDPQIFGANSAKNKDRGARKKKKGQPIVRDVTNGVTNFMVHQTGNPQDSGLRNSISLPVHAKVQGDGTNLILLQNFEHYMEGGDGCNSYSVQLEIDGAHGLFYEAKQILCAQLFATYFYGVKIKLWKEAGNEGLPPMTVGGHLMYKTEKPNDPGRALWMEVCHWAMDNLGFKLDPLIGGANNWRYVLKRKKGGKGKVKRGGKFPHVYYEPDPKKQEFFRTKGYAHGSTVKLLNSGALDTAPAIHSNMYPYSTATHHYGNKIPPDFFKWGVTYPADDLPDPSAKK